MPNSSTKMTPEELIKLSLGSNDKWINHLQGRREQEQETKARRTPSVILSQTEGPPVEWGERAAQAPTNTNDVQRLAQSYAASQYGWSGEEWNALYELVSHESGWDPNISNPSSHAFGLFQFMPIHFDADGYLPQGTSASTMQQIEAGLRYIADRYGSPSRALDHWQRRVPINGEDVGHWY